MNSFELQSVNELGQFGVEESKATPPLQVCHYVTPVPTTEIISQSTHYIAWKYIFGYGN